MVNMNAQLLVDRILRKRVIEEYLTDSELNWYNPVVGVVIITAINFFTNCFVVECSVVRY